MVHMTQMYCTNPRCNAREIEVLTKAYDSPDADLSSWRCPVCQELLVVHWRKTLQEYEQRELAHSISRVKGAIYNRDHGPAVPLSVLSEDDLPDDWTIPAERGRRMRG